MMRAVVSGSDSDSDGQGEGRVAAAQTVGRGEWSWTAAVAARTGSAESAARPCCASGNEMSAMCDSRGQRGGGPIGLRNKEAAMRTAAAAATATTTTSTAVSVTVAILLQVAVASSSVQPMRGAPQQRRELRKSGAHRGGDGRRERRLGRHQPPRSAVALSVGHRARPLRLHRRTDIANADDERTERRAPRRRPQRSHHEQRRCSALQSSLQCSAVRCPIRTPSIRSPVRRHLFLFVVSLIASPADVAL